MKSSRKSYVKQMAMLTLGALAASALFVGGGWEEKRELENKAKADQRPVASILVYQCDLLQGLFIIPETGPVLWHNASEPIPLGFYKDTVVSSKNGVMRFTVPCPKRTDTLARN